MQKPPYLQRVSSRPDRFPENATFPFDLGFVAELELEFRTAITFLVGENGSGKSTLLEALAVLCDFPARGGGRSELAAQHAPDTETGLADALRPAFRSRPWKGFFFRAEFQAHLATLFDERGGGDGRSNGRYDLFGDRPLHARSHGEAFLEIMLNRLGPGLFLMDEPESALSPQRQLTLLSCMAELASQGETQFIVATHSPILLTCPGATIVSFDDETLPLVALEDTSHFQITKGILNAPERYWRDLTKD